MKGAIQPFLAIGIDKIEEQAEHKEFLQLHTRLLYALQAVSFIYAGLKGKELPEEFSKVEQYYGKIETIDLKERPPTTIDKQKAKRLLKTKR